MKATHTLEKLASQLQARRSALWRAYELNSLEFDGDDEDEPGEAEAVANILQSEFRELLALDHALERYREGVYGHCEACGRAISVTRLRAIPYATYCIRCQREAEFES